MAGFVIRAVLEGIDRITAPFRSSERATSQLRAGLAAAQETLGKLDRAASDMASFRTLKSQALESARALRETRQSAQALERGYQTAATASADLETQLKAARRAADRLRRIGADTSELVAAEATVTSLERALRSQNNETRKAERDWTRATRAADSLQAQADRQRESMDALSTRLREAGIDTNRLAGADQRLAGEAAHARAEIERQTEALNQQQRRTDALNRANERMAKTRAAAVKLAAVGAIALSVGGGTAASAGLFANAGISFEATMSEVGAITQLEKGSAKLAELKADAEKLGAETAFSATDAGKGQKLLAMAGFTADEILKASRGTLDLATAGGVGLETSADISSNILRAFKIDAGDMARVTDTLTTTFTNSNTSLELLGETMKYAAPIANQLGISIEETSAMAGLLGNIGIKGSEAGTALRAIFNRLAAPPKAAADALQELGIKTTDAAGNLREMPEILADMAEATKGMGNAQKMAYLKDIGGEEAAGALAELISQSDVSADKIREFYRKIKESRGSTDRVAKQMADNTKGDLDALSSAWEGFQIVIFDSNNGPLRSIIQGLSGVVNAVSGWAKANPELTTTIVQVGAVVTGLTVGAGVLAMSVAGLLMPFSILQGVLGRLGIGLGGIGRLFSFGGTVLRLFGSGVMSLVGLLPRLVTGLQLVGTAIRAIGLAMAANPIGAVIAGIAIAATLIYVYWEPISGFFGEVLEKIKGPLATCWDYLKMVFSWTPLGIVIANWDGITGYMSGLWTTVTGLAAAAWDGLQALFFGFTPLGLVIANWDALPAYFAGLWDQITASTMAAIGWISDAISSLAAPFEWLAEQIGLASSAPIPAMAMPSSVNLPASSSTASLATSSGGMRQTNQTNTQTNHITINAQPGMDERAISAELQRKMAEANRTGTSVGAGQTQLYDGVD